MLIRHIQRGCQRSELFALHLLKQYEIAIVADYGGSCRDIKAMIALQIPRNEANDPTLTSRRFGQPMRTLKRLMVASRRLPAMRSRRV